MDRKKFIKEFSFVAAGACLSFWQQALLFIFPMNLLLQNIL
jgi:hypothetical protein